MNLFSCQFNYINMPCSKCKEPGHNRRTCKQSEESSTFKEPEESSTITKVKGFIVNRRSTINYEFEKTLIKNISQKSYKEFNDDEINKMMITPICVYCGDKGKLNSDHIISVVTKDKTKTIYSDFSNIKVPCCGLCNSAKGNTDWKDYILKKKTIEGYEKRYQLLEKLELLILTKRTKYIVSEEDKELNEQELRKTHDQMLKLQERANRTRLIKVED